MKKCIAILLAIGMLFALGACAEKEGKKMDPQVAQMRSICELATLDCYYHNVAKYLAEDAEGFLFWWSDRHFWVEYAGQVSVGIDASLVTMELPGISGEHVKITIPPAKVLGCKVDEATLTEESFIIAKGSARITAEHQTAAFKEAQARMQAAAENNIALLANAQQRAQALLEDYVNNIGEMMGKEYEIEWVYVNAEGEPAGGPQQDAAGGIVPDAE